MRGNLKARLERLEQVATKRESPLILFVTSYAAAEGGNLGLLTGVEIDGDFIKRDLESETEELFFDRVRNEHCQSGRSFIVVGERRVSRDHLSLDKVGELDRSAGEG